MILRKRLRSRVGILTAVLLAGSFALLAFLKYGLDSDWFLKRIRDAVNENIPGSVSWEAVSISPGAGQLTVKGLSIRDKSNQDILNIKELGLTILLKRLVQKQLVFETVTIHCPQILLTAAENGRINLMDALVAPQPGKKTETDNSRTPSVRVIFKNIQVRGGRIELDGPENRFYLSAAVPNADLNNFDITRLKGRLKINAQDVTYGIGDLLQEKTSIDLYTEFSKKTIFFKKVHIRSSEADMDITGDIDLTGSKPRVNLKFLSDIRLAPSAEFFKINRRTSGTLNAAMNINGSIDNPVADLSVSADRIDVAGHVFENLELASNLKGHQLAIDPSRVQTEFGTLVISAGMDLSSLFRFPQHIDPAVADKITYTVRARIVDTDISSFLSVQKPMKGIADTHITVDGTGFHPQRMKTVFDIQTRITGPDRAGERNESLSLSAKLSGKIEDGGVSVPEFELNTLGVTATGKASYRFDTRHQRCHFSIAIPDLAPFSFLVGSPVSGNVQITGDLSGQAGHQSGQAIISGAEITYDQFRINSLELTSYLDSGRLFIDPLKMNGHGSTIGARGSLQLFKPGTADFHLSDMNLTLSGDKIDLGEFYDDASGLVSLSGHLTGPPDQPEGQFTLSGSRIRIHGEQIESINASAHMMDGEIKIGDLDVTVSPDAAIKGTGRYDIQHKTFDAHIRTQSFPLKTVAHLREKMGGDGKIDVDLKATGRINNPIMNTNFLITGMKIGEEDLPDMAASLTLKEKELRLKSNFYGDWKGFYHLDTKQFELHLETDRLKLSPYMRMAGQNDLSGEMKGRLSISGKTNNLNAVHADLDISDLSILFKDMEIIKSDRIRLLMENKKFSTPGTAFSLFKTGSGRVSVDNSEKESPVFVIQITLPMEAVDPAFEQISDIKGEMGAEIRISGSVAQPGLKGTLTFREIGMALPVFENELSRISGSVHFDNTKLFSDGITGTLGDGRFKITGKADIDKTVIKDAVILAECRQLPLDIQGTMDLKLDGNLKFSGNRMKSSLTGNLFLVEGRYYKNVRIDLSSITKPQRPVAQVPEKKPNPFLASMILNVDVDKRAPFLVENNLCTMTAIPDLTPLWHGHHPLISGRAEVNEGVIRFQRKEFEIKKGVVNFSDPYRITPTLDLEAQTDIREWHVTLKLSGPHDNLDFVLSSEPEESHADILSLITLGMTTRELRNSQGGSNYSPAWILVDFLAQTAQENIKAQTGLDQVEIRMGDTQDSGSVVLGKELSRQLSIRYGVEIRGGENLQRVSSDYLFLENLILNAYQDSAGDFGGCIKLRLEF